MKILLDTNFIRNLGKARQLELLSKFAEQLKWEYYLPKIVYGELAKRSVPKEITDLITKNKIKIETCEQDSFERLQLKFFSLGEGELEAICIVNKCEDRKFRCYLIMTDDEEAQKKAFSLGMSSFGTVFFLFTANQKGLLKKDEAKTSLDLLNRNGFAVDSELERDFLKRLV